MGNSRFLKKSLCGFDGSEGGRRMKKRIQLTCKGCNTVWESRGWKSDYLDECPECTADLEIINDKVCSND